MIQSMTGFATVAHRGEAAEVQIRLRSVNSRFLDCRIRLPSLLQPYEDSLYPLVRSAFSRGKIDIDVELKANTGVVKAPSINSALAESMASDLRQIGERLGLSGDISLETLCRVMGPQLFEHSEGDSSSEELVADLIVALKQGLTNLTEARLAEGKALTDDLGGGIENLRQLVQQIDTAQQGLELPHAERLTARLQSLELSDEQQQTRIQQEIALLLDKMDIHEELVRLKTHMDAFEQTRLKTTEPCGKRLDFLLQEVLREVNTIGSKVADAIVRGLVVDMKVQVEKLRQQVANVA
tara:strand:- start:3832 stop:4719 length:888 start_codon:yes stop_codon:yes gene_type:complete